MDRSVSRIGAWAGWLALLGIAGYHIGLAILAGPRVSGTLDAAAIDAYYGQSSIAALGVAQFIVVVPMAVFVVALREALLGVPLGRLLTGVALAAVVAEIPVILTEIAAQAALVSAVHAGENVVGLFRFWDALYNSGAYALEATWVLAFGVAMRGVPAFPRWIWGLTVVTALLLAANVTAIWIGIPDPATLPSAVLLSVWIAGASIGLRRGSMAEAIPAAALQAA